MCSQRSSVMSLFVAYSRAQGSHALPQTRILLYLLALLRLQAYDMLLLQLSLAGCLVQRATRSWESRAGWRTALSAACLYWPLKVWCTASSVASQHLPLQVDLALNQTCRHS